MLDELNVDALLNLADTASNDHLMELVEEMTYFIPLFDGQRDRYKAAALQMLIGLIPELDIIDRDNPEVVRQMLEPYKMQLYRRFVEIGVEGNLLHHGAAHRCRLNNGFSHIGFPGQRNG
jgi:hypothetical protein